jgi:hypothetical protein
VVAVNDILSFGRERPPRRKRPWRLAVAAASLAAVLVAALIWYLPGARPHGAQAEPTAAPSLVRPSAPPVKPARMTGQPLPRDAGLSLLLGGHGPAWLGVTTGRSEPVRGLPRSGNGYQFIRIAGGWAAQPFPVTTGCGNCAPGPLPVYYLADGARTASRVGTADFAASAATRGALWLVSYRRGADMSTVRAPTDETSRDSTPSSVVTEA